MHLSEGPAEILADVKAERNSGRAISLYGSSGIAWRRNDPASPGTCCCTGCRLDELRGCRWAMRHFRRHAAMS